MGNLINVLNGLVWSTPLLVLVLGGGLFFTIATRFVQIRQLKEMVTLMFKGIRSEKTETGVSSFQALMMSVASRVGTGNIAGVATAIGLGGPGAVFWMWMVAILGASTSFIESTMAQIFKEKHGNEFRGGPAYYIERGLKSKALASFFAFTAMVAFGAFLNMPQANTISSSMNQAFGISPLFSGILICTLFGVIVFGGVKRIASVAEMLVPFMAIAYIAVAIIIIIVNIQSVPAVFSLIFKSAFNAEPLFGGMIGSAISWGVKRGVFSNEAGMGTAPHAAAAANVKHPAEQGFVQAFSVYIDTLFVCSATAFMILITNMYNVVGPDGELIVNNIGDVEIGPVYTQMAVDTLVSGWGSIFVAVAVFFFAFTTMISLYYYGETSLVYLTKGENKSAKTAFRLFVVASLYYGAVKTSGIIWGFADLGMGVSAWINIIVILLFHKPAIKALKDYETQKSQGVAQPIFNPVDLGIENADYWENEFKANKKVG